MADNIERLAVLIEANTKSFENAMKRLQQLTEKSLNGVNNSFTRPGKGANDLEKALKNADKQTGRFSGSVTQLSFQLNDVFTGLASGQRVMQVFAQQGGQIFQVWQMNRSVFSQTASALSSLITPTRLIIGGILATTAALTASFFSWKNYALQIDDVRRLTGQTSESLAALNTAAAFRGIDDTSFFDALRKFSTDVYNARIGMGDLAELLHANGSAASDVEHTFARVADLVKNARDDQQRVIILQRAGLPTARSWIDLMSQGAAGIRAAKEEATAFGGAANDAMIAKAKQFDEEWNLAVRNLKTGFRNLFLDAKSRFDTLIQLARQGVIAFDRLTGGNSGATRQAIGRNVLQGAMSGNVVLGANVTRLNASGANDFYNAFGNRFSETANAAKTIDPQAIQRSIQLQQQYLGVLGQTLTVDQQIRQVELQIQSYQTQPGAKNLTEQQIDNLKRLARERALGIDQIHATRDALDVEAATIGMDVGQAEAYAAVQNKINEYKRLGVPLTEENIAAIRREADAMGAAAQRVQNLRDEQEIIHGFGQDMLSSLQQGKNAWEAFGTAAVNALNRIESKLLDKALDSLLFGGGLSGGGGGIGGIFSFLFGGFRAGGGDVTAGKAYVVGEQRPELFVPNVSGRIIPSTAAMATGSGGGITIADYSTNNFNAGMTGADRAFIDEMVDRKISASESRVMQKVRQLNLRRAG